MCGVDTPLLMSLNDMDALGMDLRTMNNELFFDGRGQKLARDEKNRLVLKWKYRVECLYTDRELHKFHRAFGHTSVDRIMKSLQAADYSQLDGGTRSKLHDIEHKCESCQYNSSRPKHFSIPQHYLGNRFNHVVKVDIFKVDDGEVLHVICTGTDFTAARFTSQRNATAEEIWRLIRLCWIDVYVDPPDVIRVDQGSNLSKSFMNTACTFYGIKLDPISTEAAWRVGTVERKHSLIRHAYDSIKRVVPSMSKEEWLQMAVKTVNDTVDVSGVSPTYAVFGANPRPFPALSKHHAPINADRAKAMESAKRTVKKARAQQSVERARVSHPPFRGEARFSIGDNVLVYRTATKAWEGQYQIMEIVGEVDVVVKNITTGSRSTFEQLY
jgi:hypothetical protein